MVNDPKIAAVIIGRNEGARLVRCLASVTPLVRRVVYVDSGSTDGSPEAARAASAEVVRLDLAQPFTAARARNAGIAALREGMPPDYVQFIDGDCELQPGWIDTARAFLDSHPKAAVACGRRRERFPEASVYNRLCDREWDTPVGKARACGGDALMRWAALDEVGGYNPALIAGEEPEMCVRLRAKGWEIWRIDAEMALHDAAMTRVGQWWKREHRNGYAYAQGFKMHGAKPERHGAVGVCRALLWGIGVPIMAGLATLVTPLGALVLAAYPLQIARRAVKERASAHRWHTAIFDTLNKFPQALGCIHYATNDLRKRSAKIMEYK